MHHFVSAHMCTFLLQNDALWDICLRHVGFARWSFCNGSWDHMTDGIPPFSEATDSPLNSPDGRWIAILKMTVKASSVAGDLWPDLVTCTENPRVAMMPTLSSLSARDVVKTTIFAIDGFIFSSNFSLTIGYNPWFINWVLTGLVNGLYLFCTKLFSKAMLICRGFKITRITQTRFHSLRCVWSYRLRYRLNAFEKGTVVKQLSFFPDRICLNTYIATYP